MLQLTFSRCTTKGQELHACCLEFSYSGLQSAGHSERNSMKYCAAILTFPLLICSEINSFSASKLNQRHHVRLQAQAANDEHDQEMSRRSLLIGALGASLLTTVAPNAVMAQDEIPITPFNGLIFNYRGSDYGGLDASTLDEPSVPFREFAERLSKGEVKFVEFLAPNGDEAYVTFKEGDGKPIRIGEGYPIEKHDGWSSPAFVVRAVENYKVPYKFTVPGLAAYRQ